MKSALGPQNLVVIGCVEVENCIGGLRTEVPANVTILYKFHCRSNINQFLLIPVLDTVVLASSDVDMARLTS